MQILPKLPRDYCSGTTDLLLLTIMEYANLSQMPSPSVTEHFKSPKNIPCRPSPFNHDSSIVNCESIVMEGFALSLKSPLSVTSGRLSRKPGNLSNQHANKNMILDNHVVVPRPDSSSAHDTTMRYEDLFPKCLDLLPLLDDQPSNNASSQDYPVDTVKVHGTCKRRYKFVLQPRSQPEMLRSMTFLDFDTQDISSSKRQKLMGSFVSLDAEAHPCTSDCDVDTRPIDGCYGASTTSCKSTELPLGNTIALPVVYASTIPIGRSDDVKPDDTKSRKGFQPSRYSAFSISTGLRRTTSTSWIGEPSGI